jgi:hypothetical protein
MELKWYEHVQKRLYWNRLQRLVQHYSAIKDELAPRGKDKEEVAFFTSKFEQYAKRTNHLMHIRFFFYLILYATLLVNVFKIIPLLAFLVTFIEVGSAVFGTTIAIAAVFLLTLRINLNLGLMQDCLSHLIVIYHSNHKRKSKEVLAKIAKAI